MQIVSQKRSYPLLGSIGILVCIGLMVSGVTELGKDDPTMAWLRILTGLFILPSWVMRIMRQVVLIVIDDNTIRYQRRRGQDQIIARSEIIGADISARRIRFRYKGPSDINSATIPLTLFRSEDANALSNMFTGIAEAQQVVTRQPA